MRKIYDILLVKKSDFIPKISPLIKSLGNQIIRCSIFKITKNTSVLVILWLSQSMQIHDLIYSYLIWKTSIERLINKINELSSLVIVNNKDVYRVESIFMLEVIGLIVNIKLNRFEGKKTKTSIIQIDH